MDMRDSVEVRLWFLMGLVHSSSGLYVWCYSKEGRLYYSSAPDEQVLEMFFTIGGCKEYAFGEGKKCNHPFIMSDPLGLVWIGEYATAGNQDRLLSLIGPFFFGKSSVRNIEERLRRMDLSVELSRNCRKVLEKLPYLTTDMMTHYSKMLHYAITGEESGDFTLSRQNPAVQGESFDCGGEEEEPGEGLIDYELLNSQEQMLLQCVRDGNKNYQEAFSRIQATNASLYSTGNPQRDGINMIIAFTTQCARAAMEAGVPPRIAKPMELSFIRKAEDTTTLVELMNVNQNMIEAFIQKVSEIKLNQGRTKPIRECCDYIKEHFTEPLTLERISGEIGYTKYYLTKKFQQEMGMRMSDYIKEVRLEYAKIWLMTTNKSIQDISDQLQFGARSYFSRVFKEKNGVTPARFREQAWKQEKKEAKDK